MQAGEQHLQLDSPAGLLDAVLIAPDHAVAQLLFAHGAGAGYQHATMSGLAESFAEAGLATLRFNFPFMQQGKRRVDSKDVAVSSIVTAADYMRRLSDLPLVLCGHSFGGRMCTHAVVQAEIDCTALVLCSFPLHPPKKPGIERAAHLPDITQPMLFLSGTRDGLATADLLQGMVEGLNNSSRIHWLETANHSYTILKRKRTNATPVFAEMAQQARAFVDEVI